ncbi:hypothetical protein KNJ79_11650 [Sphingopyxis indica]|uniref:Uncharacterized protein n=2 Tax=Sphingopyxis indica TaxID=436663 RepID=A0A239LEN9_9SPHN|nr:hypothetical protein KNJ79_11650 [Sphingopyxis indica]SNT29097.1 hypothetical protein SAMN06295955_12322 [Sphingopyxis indica]
MPPSRTRLINAARRSMLQRSQLRRKLGIAGEAFKPSALAGRARNQVQEAIDDSAHAVREQFRRNRLPIALAAVAGVAWLFREPIKQQAPRIGRKLGEIADRAMARLRPGDDVMADEAQPDMEEDDDETPQ